MTKVDPCNRPNIVGLGLVVVVFVTEGNYNNVQSQITPKMYYT